MKAAHRNSLVYTKSKFTKQIKKPKKVFQSLHIFWPSFPTLNFRPAFRWASTRKLVEICNTHAFYWNDICSCLFTTLNWIKLNHKIIAWFGWVVLGFGIYLACITLVRALLALVRPGVAVGLAGSEPYERLWRTAPVLGLVTKSQA